MKNFRLSNFIIFLAWITFLGIAIEGKTSGGAELDQSADSDSSKAASEDNSNLKWAVYPGLAYTPETRIFGGYFASFIFASNKESHSNNVANYAVVSQNKQAEIGFETELWLAHNSVQLASEIKYRYWPEKYYGVGVDTEGLDGEAYTAEGFEIKLGLNREYFTNVYPGILIEYQIENFSDFKTPQFAHWQYDGSRFGIGPQIVHDSRDSDNYPGKGWLNKFNYLSFMKFFGADYKYRRHDLDLRYYNTIIPGSIFAMQLAFASINGKAPLKALNSLANELPGLIESKFLDNMRASMRFELRQKLPFKKLGFTVFAGLGDTAASPGKLGKPLFIAGFGGRYLFVPKYKLNASLDLAWGRDGVELYMRLGESF
jgi:hypothetical protein